MRKVFLEDLPRKDGNIDWVNSVGCKIKFTYNDISDKIEITECDKGKSILKIKYEGNENFITTSNFLKCKLGNVLRVKSSEFKMSIGHTLRDYKRDLTIIERMRKVDKTGISRKYYKYNCNKCGFNGNMSYYKDCNLYSDGYWIEESSLLNGNGCSCCCHNPQVVVEGINDIFTTNNWMIGVGVDKEEAKKFTKSSNKKIKCVCPYCGEVKYKTINNINNHKSMSCKCGDGQSYISKYIYSLLKQLNIEFDTEVKYNWNKYTNPKNNKLTQASIDFIIYHNGKEIPLEADGGFHRENNRLTKTDVSVQQYIDKQRDKNCLKYLGEETIRISDEGDLRENILNSKLAKEFDLSLVDWLKCEEYAINSNKVKEVCDYWNNKQEWETTTDLSHNFNVDACTIVKYLKEGDVLGWTDYCAKKEIRRIASINGKLLSKKVQIFKDGSLLGVFDSISDLERSSVQLFGVKFNHGNISVVCNGKKTHYKGYIFKYIENSQEVV